MEMMMFERKSSDSVSLIGIIFFLVFLNCFIILRDFFSTLGCIIQFFTKLLNAFPIIACNNHEDAETEKKRLSIGEVRTMMERLQNLSDGDGDGDGVGGEGEITCREMEELFEEEPSVEEMKEAFDVFDENGDGFIDSEELKKALSAMGFSHFSEVESERMIRAFDCNGDGRIDFQEFLQLSEQSF